MFRTFFPQPSINNAAIALCIWSHFPVSVQGKGIFDLVGFTNQEQQLPVFWRQIRQGCDLITFSVAGIKRRGYNIYMLWWYLKTILDSLILNFDVAFWKTINQKYCAKFPFHKEKARVEIYQILGLVYE